MKAALKQALAERAFEPAFQPIVRLSDQKLAGFEALARWRREDGSLAEPAAFLDEAFAHDLMGAVSRLILEKTAEAFGGWRARHTAAGALFVAVNISGGDLEDSSLLAAAQAARAAAGAPPGALKLEVTEHQVLADPEKAAEVLRAVRESGLGVALDDFGTGHSGLSWLVRLPADSLKIDQSFVREAPQKGAAYKIVRALIGLAHDLGLSVVAEGVETQDVRAILTELRCDYGQGHVFAPPLPAEAAEAVIAAGGDFTRGPPRR